MNSADLIKTMRKKAVMSRQELADKVGATISSVYNWEGGKTSPSADMLLAIARVTGYELILMPKQFKYGGD